MKLIYEKILLKKHVNQKYFIDNHPLLLPTKKLDQLFLKIVKTSKNFFGDCFDSNINKNAININELYNASIKDHYSRYFFLWFLKNNHALPPVGDHKNVYRDMRKQVLKRFIKKINTKMVLDIGCDNIAKNENGYKANFVIGLDPFPKIKTQIKYLNLGKTKLNAINKIHSFAEFLPFKNQIFDLIIFDGSFDHLLDWKGSLNETNRCLKKKGKLIISVLNWNNKETIIKDIFHFHHFSSSEIILYLENKGFELTEKIVTPWKNQNFRNVANLLFSKK